MKILKGNAVFYLCVFCGVFEAYFLLVGGGVVFYRSLSAGMVHIIFIKAAVGIHIVIIGDISLEGDKVFFRRVEQILCADKFIIFCA